MCLVVNQIGPYAIAPACQIGHNEMQLLSVKEVSLMFGVSQAWVRDHATRKQPHLKCVKVGKLLRFRPEDVQEFIEKWCV